MRRFNQLEVDGILSLPLVILAIPCGVLVNLLVAHFEGWDTYGTLAQQGGFLTAITVYALSVGFGISGLRQSRRLGRAFSGIALLGPFVLCFLLFLLLHL